MSWAVEDLAIVFSSFFFLGTLLEAATVVFSIQQLLSFHSSCPTYASLRLYTFDKAVEQLNTKCTLFHTLCCRIFDSLTRVTHFVCTHWLKKKGKVQIRHLNYWVSTNYPLKKTEIFHPQLLYQMKTPQATLQVVLILCGSPVNNYFFKKTDGHLTYLSPPYLFPSHTPLSRAHVKCRWEAPASTVVVVVAIFFFWGGGARVVPQEGAAAVRVVVAHGAASL